MAADGPAFAPWWRQLGAADRAGVDPDRQRAAQGKSVDLGGRRIIKKKKKKKKKQKQKKKKQKKKQKKQQQQHKKKKKKN